ncbi:PAS domain S-box protein [Limisphaera sp. VF-2]|uniref:PAS domain S-box protein n=1 Tax=Limisphaera sp. VF-2 TaxID=3400418 RepID=UPI00175DDF61
MRVLVVDDNPDNLYLLRTLLAGQGYEVEEARDGAEALGKARQHPPDLVISDLLMPVMDGFALLREWKTDPRLQRIPFVVYTATYTNPEDERLVRDLGADAFIIKPAEPEPFLARLRQVMEQAARKALPVALPRAEEGTRLSARHAEALIRKLEQKRTELEKLNRELTLASEHLRRILDLLPTAAYTCNAEGLLTYYNLQARALLGREPRLLDPADRFCGSSRWLHPDGTPVPAAENWTAVCLREARTVHGGVVLIERPDGSRRTALAHAAPLLDEAGRAVGAVNVLEDITETLELFDALQQSEERFRRLAETTSTAIFVYSGEYFCYVNPATCAITGRTAPELLSMRFWEVVHPEHRDLVRQRGPARQRGEAVPARYEFKILRKDGTERWIDFTAGQVTWEGRPAAIGTAFDITERKQAEEALRESETRNRIIANLVSDYAYIFRVLPDGTLRGEWVTDSFVKAFGLTIPEIDARGGWQSLVHPEDLPIALAHARKVISGQRDVCEMRWVTPAGQIRWMRDYAEPVFDDSGARVIRIYGASQDITERKEAEARVVRLNRTYAVLSQINQLIVRERDRQALLEGACRIAVDVGGFVMACIAVADDPGQRPRVVASAGAGPDTLALVKEIFEDPGLGCALSEAAYTTGSHAVCNRIATDPRAAPWREAALSRGYRAMGAFPLPVSGRPRGVFHLYAATEDFFDAEEVQLLNELAQDLGFALETIEREQARREAEARLASSEERFRQLAATVEDFFWIRAARSHQFLYVSPAFAKIWGLPPETLFEDPNAWLRYVHPDDQERVRQTTLSPPAQDPYDVAYRIVRPDGQLRWVRSRIYRVYSPTGELDRFIGVTRDITREYQLEEQLRQSQKMEAIGRLAGGVAHDFNNILTAILMQTELLTDTEELPAHLREGLHQIHAAAERAANLTRQLLLFSRREVLQPRLLDLNETVAGMAKMLQRIIGEDIRLQLVLHPGPLWLRADPGMLDQVLMNLAVNARDALPRGGQLMIETSEVLVDESRAALHPGTGPGPYARLRVQDTGCGIPPEVLPHIFEPFFTTKEPGKGTGLGLATVYGIVEQHRGWIEVQSTPGQGTTFEIYLPLHAEAKAHESLPVRPKPRGGSETILLVEDDERLRQIARAALERHGYRVWEAGDAAEALRLWTQRGSSVQLLLTDLVMPGSMNGRELARQLQQERPDLKVILVSGYSQDLAGRVLELEPGQAFLSKPFAPDELLHLVRRVLDEP